MRVGQRFGANHVASVLRGHASEQVTGRGHHTLSTFGLLPDASVAEVRGYIEQLIGLDLLRLNGDEYPVLGVTSKGIELLKDEYSYPGLALARQRAPRKDAPRTSPGSKPNRGRASTARSSSACARCGSTSRDRAACRRT